MGSSWSCREPPGARRISDYRAVACTPQPSPAKKHGARPPLRLDLCIGAIAVVVSVAISIAVVLLSFDKAKSDLEENTRILVSGAAQEAAGLLRASLLESQRLTVLTTRILEQDLARGGTAAARVQADRPTVNFLKTLMPFASWIGLVDSVGMVSAASDGLLEGQSVAARLWFSETVKSRAPYFGDIHPAVLLQKLLAPNSTEPLRFVDVGAPVTFNGSIVGVLGVHLHWEWARDVQQRTMNSVYSAASGEMFVFSFDDSVLLSPDPALWKESAASSAPPACARAVRQSGSGRPATSREAWPAPSKAGEYISACSLMRQGAIEWVVVVRAPAPSVNQGATVYASAGAIASVLMGALLSFLVWLGMRPFHKAVSSAQRLEAELAELAGVPREDWGAVALSRRSSLKLGPAAHLFEEVHTLQGSIARLEWTVRRALSLRSELREADAERANLREQVRTLQREKAGTQADLESPLAKALAALLSLRSDPRFQALGSWAEASLGGALNQLLARGSMMVPDLGRQVRDGLLRLDRDTQHWLFSEIAPSQGERLGSESPPAGAGRGGQGGLGGEAMRGPPVLQLAPESPVQPLYGGAETAARELVPLLTAWEPFDPFRAASDSGGRPLLAVALAALEAIRLPPRLRLDAARFAAFVSHVEDGYLENPYHNRTHAADVTQCMTFLLTRGGLGGYLTDEDRLAGVIASVIHDFEHPGVNNNFLVAVSDPLALRYNDKSPLESHHVSAAWSALVSREDLNFLSNWPRPALKELRRTVIDMVLATDMAQHFEVLGAWRKRVAAGAFPPLQAPEVAPAAEGATASGAPPLPPEDRRLLLSVAMKAADIANAARPFELHREWSQRISEEFFAQGDREKAAGMPVSAFMDRETANLPKSQVGFSEFIVMPLFKAFGEAFPIVESSVVASAMSNYARWTEMLSTPAAPAASAPAVKAAD
eukprot:tig00000215_g18675.t1